MALALVLALLAGLVPAVSASATDLVALNAARQEIAKNALEHPDAVGAYREKIFGGYLVQLKNGRTAQILVYKDPASGHTTIWGRYVPMYDVGDPNGPVGGMGGTYHDPLGRGFEIHDSVYGYNFYNPAPGCCITAADLAVMGWAGFGLAQIEIALEIMGAPAWVQGTGIPTINNVLAGLLAIGQGMADLARH